jgi:hypothetical protein
MRAGDPVQRQLVLAYQELLSDALQAYWAAGNQELPLQASERMALAFRTAAAVLEQQLPTPEEAPLLRRALQQAIDLLRGPAGLGPPQPAHPSVCLEDSDDEGTQATVEPAAAG